ncbi:MAG: hypothetical protein ACLPKB_22050 [Xanthobacteraceae bacterium]
MGKNIAARRAAKALRRKAVVAEKRKAEALATTLPERVRRAAGLPIQHCLLSDRLFEMGAGVFVLARGRTSDHLTVGIFFLDVFCLGVKDAAFVEIDGDQFEMRMQAMPSTPVDPAYGRKLVRDLAAWAGSIGFPTHRDFAAVERLFGEVKPETCDVAFLFGREGKPFYISSPSDSLSQTSRRVEQLQERLGSDGFDYLVSVTDAPAIDADSSAEFMIVDDDWSESV